MCWQAIAISPGNADLFPSHVPYTDLGSVMDPELHTLEYLLLHNPFLLAVGEHSIRISPGDGKPTNDT